MKKTGQPEGMSRFTYCYFFRPGILTLPAYHRIRL